ncbi:hypothetical protein AOLI_G00068850, partial [Acnodon oligacanthus]
RLKWVVSYPSGDHAVNTSLKKKPLARKRNRMDNMGVLYTPGRSDFLCIGPWNGAGNFLEHSCPALGEKRKKREKRNHYNLVYPVHCAVEEDSFSALFSGLSSCYFQWCEYTVPLR